MKTKNQEHQLTVGGVTRCLTEWSVVAGVHRTAILRRIRRGLTPEECIAPSRRARIAKGHPLHSIWRGIIYRCEFPSHVKFKNYGGRGITICSRWRNDFFAFVADVGERPSAKHTIDRINNDGHYEPGNVRWATAAEQARNRRPSTRSRGRPFFGPKRGSSPREANRQGSSCGDNVGDEFALKPITGAGL